MYNVLHRTIFSLGTPDPFPLFMPQIPFPLLGLLISTPTLLHTYAPDSFPIAWFTHIQSYLAWFTHIHSDLYIVLKTKFPFDIYF